MTNAQVFSIDYKTHILLGIRTSGNMDPICAWPYVPKLQEVEREMSRAMKVYVRFVLCTPTAIMPGSIRSRSIGTDG
jgi:hypothetical protein